MPRVPTLNNQQVSTAAIPGVRPQPLASPQAFGSGMGRALQGAAGAAASIVEDEQRKQDQVWYSEQLDRFYEWENTRIHDAVNGALAQRGKNAFGLPDQIRSELDEFAKGLRESASNDNQRMAVERLISQRSREIDRIIQRHVARELQAYDDATTESLIQNSRSAAIANMDDPLRIAAEIQRQEAAIRDYAARHGLGPEYVKAKSAGAVSATHLGVIDRMIVNGMDEDAEAYLSANRDDILGADLAGVEARIERARMERVKQAIDSASLDISASLLEGNIGDARSKLDAHLRSIPEGMREKFRQDQTRLIDVAESRKIENDRSVRTERMVSAINAGYMSRDDALKFAADSEERFARNPRDPLALDPRQVASIREAVAQFEKTEDGAARIARRFGGDLTVSMPADEGSRNKFVQQTLATAGDRPRTMASMARFFEAEGQPMPKALLDEIGRAFERETLDLDAGLRTLEAVSERSARRIINELPQSRLAQTLFDMTRGTDPASPERQRVIEVLSRPDAPTWIEHAETDLAGVAKRGNPSEWEVAPLDKLATLRRYAGLKDTAWWRPGDQAIPLSAEASRLFDSIYRFEMARIAQSTGATSPDDVSELVKASAAKLFAQRAVSVPVPTPGPSLGQPDFDTFVVAPADGLGLGTLAEPDAAAIHKFQQAIVGLKGDFMREGWFGTGLKGVVRPDLAFGLPGSKDKIIPIVQDGEPIGFVQWRGDAQVVVSSVDRKSESFDTLKQIMEVGSDRLELVGNPALRWRPEYGVRTVLDLPEGPTAQAILDGINAAAIEQFRRLHGGRMLDPRNEEQMATFNLIRQRVAQEHGWIGMGGNTNSEAGNDNAGESKGR